MYEHEIIPAYGANSDDDPRSFPQGWYRELWYARLGENVKHGFCIVTAQGDVLVVENEDLETVDEVIGAIGWVEGNSVMYLVYKYSGIHEIWRYYVQIETHVLISADPIYNFQRGKKINHIVVGLNSLMGWADAYGDAYDYDGITGVPEFNEPFLIDIDKMEAGDYPSPLTLQDVQFIKWPFWSGPTVEYFTDLTKGDNKLRSKLLRFRATPIYFNNQEAAYSGYSRLVTPSLSELVSGTNVASSQQDNGLHITVETGPATVRKINVAVSINGSQFGVFEQIDKDILGLADNTTYTFDYYGNSAAISLPLNLRNQDFVPKIANTMVLLPNKEIAFVGYREGWDQEVMDVSIEPVYNERLWLPRNYAMEGDFNSTPNNFRFFVDWETSFFQFQAGQQYSFTDINGVPRYYTVTQEDIDIALQQTLPEDQALYIMQVMGDDFCDQMGISVGTATLSGGSVLLYSATWPNGGSLYTFLVPVTRRTMAEEDHIKGARYDYGIQYYDGAGRAFGVWTSADLQMYVPFPSEADAATGRAGFTDVNNPYVIEAQITINHIPPIDASYYRIVRRQSVDTASFREETVVSIAQASDGRIGLRLQSDPLVSNNYQNTYEGASINSQINVGDKCRFYRKRTSNVSDPTPSDSPYLDAYFELEVMGYDQTNQVITVENLDPSLIDFASASDIGQVIQIYTPQPTYDTDGNLFVGKWFELSEKYDIGDAHTDTRYHKGTFGLIGDVSTDGNVGDTQAFTTIDLGDHDPDGRAVVFTNDNGDTETFTITATAFNGVSEWKISINPSVLAFDFSAAAGGRFNIQQNQVVVGGVSTTPAIVDLDWGDVYIRQRVSDTGFLGTSNQKAYSYYEDPAVSDYYPSNCYHYGRIGIENTENKATRYKADTMHSQVYLDQTSVNGLSDFTGLQNRFKLNESNGAIQRMKAVEKTLHVIQESCTTPIYNGTYSVGGDGEVSQPAFKNEIFGAKGREVPFGTIHPRSVQLIGNVVYLYDFNRATWAKLTDGGHGSINHGDFKYSTFAYNFTQLIQNNVVGNEKLFSFVDELNSEYTTILQIGEDFYGVVFRYDVQGWSHHVDGLPMIWAENMYKSLISTPETEIWLHNSGGDKNTFFDQYYPPSITFEMNDHPGLIKKFCVLN